MLHAHPGQNIHHLILSHFGAGEIAEATLWLRVRMHRLPQDLRAGWKLHLASTPAAYEHLLALALPVLDRLDLPFKVLRSAELLEQLNDGALGLMQVGKAVTVYPPDETAAAEAAALLAQATRGIDCPHIPSDLRYAPDAPVFFRFGPFDGRFLFDVCGQKRRMLLHPELGEVFDDPAFIPSPTPVLLPQQSPYDHLSFLRPHFEFQRVLQLSAKGVTLLAHAKARPDLPLLIKTARKGTQSDLHGRDAVWALERERRLLERLSKTGISPDPGILTRCGEGASALIRPFLEGETFWQVWTRPDARSAKALRKMSRTLVELVSIVSSAHELGIVLRDLSPGNVFLSHEGVVVLDVELAQETGDSTPPYRRGTLGFYDARQPRNAPPALTDDWRALGLLALMAHAGVHPAWWRGLPPTSPLRVGKQFGKLLSKFSPPHTEQQAQALARRVAELPQTPTAVHAPAVVGPPKEDIDLFSRLFPESPERCMVYDGFSGHILALEEISPGILKTLLTAEQAARALAILESQGARLRHIPGLYFGAPGIALACTVLGMQWARAGEETGSRMLLDVPVEMSQVPDLCQGVAGYVMAALTAHQLTRREEFLQAARQAGERLLDLAQEENGQTWWPWPEGPFPMSGARYLGLAHGVAGVSYALCALWEASQDDRFAAAARAGLRTLEIYARPLSGEALWWPVSASDETVWNAWCHGTPGIMKVLAQAARVFPETSAGYMLEAGTRGMMLANNANWCLCHGVASRLDACAAAMPLLRGGMREECAAFADADAALLDSLDPDWLRTSEIKLGIEEDGQGLMTGTLGLRLALFRWRRLRGQLLGGSLSLGDLHSLPTVDRRIDSTGDDGRGRVIELLL